MNILLVCIPGGENKDDENRQGKNENAEKESNLVIGIYSFMNEMNNLDNEVIGVLHSNTEKEVEGITENNFAFFLNKMEKENQKIDLLISNTDVKRLFLEIPNLSGNVNKIIAFEGGKALSQEKLLEFNSITLCNKDTVLKNNVVSYLKMFKAAKNAKQQVA